MKVAALEAVDAETKSRTAGGRAMPNGGSQRKKPEPKTADLTIYPGRFGLERCTVVHRDLAKKKPGKKRP
jgi:hypothetical protein